MPPPLEKRNTCTCTGTCMGTQRSPLVSEPLEKVTAAAATFS